LVLRQNGKRFKMDEKTLLALWNEKRSQIIAAQMAPSLVLISVLVLAGFGKFTDSTSAQYLAIGVTAASGILAVISQYAAIREAEALVMDLNKIENKSELAKKVGASRSFLSLTAIALVGLSVVVFALVVQAVLA
jgi:hypothetical protein